MHDHLITFLAPVTTRHGQQQVKAFQILPAVTSRHDRHTPLQAPRCCERRSRQSLGPAAIVHRMGLSVECSCGRQQTVLLAAPSFVQDAFRQTKFAMVSTMAENSQRTIPQTGPALIVKSNDQGCAKLQSSRPRAQGLATGCPVGRPGPSSHHKQNNRRSYQVPQNHGKKKKRICVSQTHSNRTLVRFFCDSVCPPRSPSLHCVSHSTYCCVKNKRKPPFGLLHRSLASHPEPRTHPCQRLHHRKESAGSVWGAAPAEIHRARWLWTEAWRASTKCSRNLGVRDAP